MAKDVKKENKIKAEASQLNERGGTSKAVMEVSDNEFMRQAAPALFTLYKLNMISRYSLNKALTLLNSDDKPEDILKYLVEESVLL